MPDKIEVPDNATVLSHSIAEILRKNPSGKFTISDLMEFYIIPEKLTGKKKEVYTGLRRDIHKRFRNAVEKLEQANIINLEYKKIAGLKRPRTIYIMLNQTNTTTNA